MPISKIVVNDRSISEVNKPRAALADHLGNMYPSQLSRSKFSRFNRLSKLQDMQLLDSQKNLRREEKICLKQNTKIKKALQKLHTTERTTQNTLSQSQTRVETFSQNSSVRSLVATETDAYSFDLLKLQQRLDASLQTLLLQVTSSNKKLAEKTALLIKSKGSQTAQIKPSTESFNLGQRRSC